MVYSSKRRFKGDVLHDGHDRVEPYAVRALDCGSNADAEAHSYAYCDADRDAYGKADGDTYTHTGSDRDAAARV